VPRKEKMKRDTITKRIVTVLMVLVVTATACVSAPPTVVRGDDAYLVYMDNVAVNEWADYVDTLIPITPETQEDLDLLRTACADVHKWEYATRVLLYATERAPIPATELLRMHHNHHLEAMEVQLDALWYLDRWCLYVDANDLEEAIRYQERVTKLIGLAEEALILYLGTRSSTPQPTLALPLSKYEGAQVSMKYPAGWEIQEWSEGLRCAAPSGCSSILITWTEWDFDLDQTAEDRYKERREFSFLAILTISGDKPQFEVLREYRLGDAPVFEYQYWNEEKACISNAQAMSYVHVETRQSVIAGWTVWDNCGSAEWHQEMDSRRALFDTVMQSITFN